MPLIDPDQFANSTALTAHEIAFYNEVLGGRDFLNAEPERREDYYRGLAKRIAIIIEAGTTAQRLGACLQLLAQHAHEFEPPASR